MYISGRLDMVLEEEDMIEFFIEFQTYFDINDFIFVFEDKTKTGLNCKPHYHFIGTFIHKRDTVAKWLGTHGKGYFSTHEIKDTEEYNKAMLYILKQQTIVFTDFEEQQLDILIEKSIDYNRNLSTLNGFRSHYLNKIMGLMKHEQLTARSSILFYIIDYVQEWNIVNIDKPMFLPPNNQMLAYIQYYEQMNLKNSTNRQMADYTFMYKDDTDEVQEFHDPHSMEISLNKVNPLDIVILNDDLDF